MANDLALHYVLTGDIDLAGAEWTPIGDYPNYFRGTFDGNGHTISNMKITDDVEYAGLFGYIASSGAVRNVALTNVDIDVGRTEVGYAYVGGIAGRSHGTVENCSVEGSVTAATSKSSSSAYAGGIAGVNDGQVENCYAIGDVEAKAEGTASSANAGGIAGENDHGGTVQNCAALGGSVSANGNSIGANRVVGNGNGTLTNNYANSAMTVNGSTGGAGTNCDARPAESWWSTSAGIDWSAVWGGDSADESRPWKMGTVGGDALPVLYWQ